MIDPDPIRLEKWFPKLAFAASAIGVWLVLTGKQEVVKRVLDREKHKGQSK